MNLSFVLARLHADERYQRLSSSLEKAGRRETVDLASQVKPYLLAALLDDLERTVLIVTSEAVEAEDIAADASAFLEPARGQDCLFFPPREATDASIPASREIISRRLKILSRLQAGRPVMVATTFGGADEVLPAKAKLPPPLIIRQGERLELDRALETLVGSGYERAYMVEKRGEFSVRGGILDVYPETEDHPFRVELLGDSVESIRTFSLATQRSIGPADEIVVFAAREETAGQAGTNVFGYLPRKSVIVLDELARLKEVQGQGLSAAAAGLAEAGHSVLELSSLRLGEALLPAEMHPLVSELGRVTDFDRLEDHLKNLAGRRFLTALVVESEGAVERMAELLSEWGLSGRSVRIVQGRLGRGFILPSIKLAVLTETDVYGHRIERRATRQHVTRSFFDLMDLEPGDYVVHINHGIGRYRGLEARVVDGIQRDYLVVEYAMGDRLYVPADQLGLVQKYVGGEGVKPVIYRLGGRRWQHVKRRARASTQRIAAELLRLYAERKSLPGYMYSPDAPWQRELEDTFPFEETPDQMAAILDVKHDMEEPAPMDRLICGDVGYGKTEVAIRAAFKAVLDGKQVAVLVPTTILALQHLRTFRERFAPFPVVVEGLSRLKTPAEQRQVLEGLTAGTVDIVIGTHRLLQKDVRLKDLGLVIVDEEQRFGVRHKESLKELRRQVDVVTLSATPIPRTLNMSLVGVRDMSVIDTPPEDRYPVTTHVGEFDEAMVANAIRRELARGGQTFYVHNRVQTIARAAERLRSLVPEARVAVAHGQLDERVLERAMLDFVERRYDILVSTTIIENGLDIPTVNTLIVDRADRLGLSQLYQLRGRVGRADLRSFAYFFYPVGMPLDRTAYERLKTIAEFTELGSGFRIAMRDLQIRGAGDLLGAEQHGFINAVGFELYADLLRESVERLKGEEKPRRAEVEIDLAVQAYIPADYIESDPLRVDAYRRIARIDREEGIKDILKELEDRYGPPPTEVVNLLSVVSLKILAQEAGVTRLYQDRRGLKLRTSDGKTRAVPGPERGSVVSLLQQVLCDIIARNRTKVTVRRNNAS